MTELYPPDDIDMDSQEAWEVELERRWEEMESGEVPGTPADRVFASFSSEQRNESGGAKMRVIGEGFIDAQPAHNNE
jgi:hypothetical protein